MVKKIIVGVIVGSLLLWVVPLAVWLKEAPQRRKRKRAIASINKDLQSPQTITIMVPGRPTQTIILNPRHKQKERKGMSNPNDPC